MRFFLVVLLLMSFAPPAMADPTCKVNDREGMTLATRHLPAGALKASVSSGMTVEVWTVANDNEGCPWALIRNPDDIAEFFGWVDRRNVTCR